MKFPTNTKPLLWGAVGGAAACMIVGFSWGGWVTGGMMTCTNAQPIDASFNPTRFGFYTCSAIGGDGLQERFFVDAYGRFCIGKGSAASPWIEKLQVHGTDGAYAARLRRRA